MLSKEEFFVLHHYLKEGVPKAAIARKLGVSRMTVFRHANSEKKEPTYTPRLVKPSILDRYKGYIRERLDVYPELTIARLLDEIKDKGYTGKYTILRDFVIVVRPKAPIEIEQRFEVAPGQQAQVDFALFKTPFGTVYALFIVLSWSRYLWIRFFLHQDQLTVLGGLNRAFITFGGVPKTLLFDRMKTAVAATGDGGKAIFNDEMLRFAAHCGFRPTACRPYRPKTKGKVERAVSYLRHGFFYGRNFRDLADLNSQCERWLNETANNRIHGTTGEIPVKRLESEKTHLLPLPAGPYTPMISLGRRLSRDGYISYNGNDYSVPEGLLKTEVMVAATLEEVRLYQGGNLIAVHPSLEGKGARHLDPNHRQLKRSSNQNKGSLNKPDIFEFPEVQRRSLEVYEGVLR